jgi:hypothetical protein
MAAPMGVAFSVDAGRIEWPDAPTADPGDHHLALDVMVDACPHQLDLRRWGPQRSLTTSRVDGLARAGLLLEDDGEPQLRLPAERQVSL